MPPIRSDLPIITPDPPPPPPPAPPLPPKTQTEKYGGLYYLGVSGLGILVLLVVWFSLSLWNLRGYLGEVYVLHDAKRSEVDRVNAALSLSRSPQANQRRYWDDALDRTLPTLARYLMGESLTAEAADADPRGYALSVARSEGWPDWLRALLVRPMAYGAAAGRSFPAEPLAELRRNADPMVGLWAAYVEVEQSKDDDSPRSFLAEQATKSGDPGQLARLLSEALAAEPDHKARALNIASIWMRTHHPSSVQVWKGWALREDRLVKDASTRDP
jgi:hypothetical protein